MCDACTLERGLEEIADLHQGDWTTTRLDVCEALCNECRDWWPCETFLTAVGAMNDVR